MRKLVFLLFAIALTSCSKGHESSVALAGDDGSFGDGDSQPGEPEAPEQAVVKVFYFGGYGASGAQMTCWESGARANSEFNKDFTFKGIPYPVGASSSASSAVSVGAAAIKSVVDEINKNPDLHYVVVGHSSGASMSNRVAELIKNPAQVELVDLDGFTPSSALQKKMKTSCWYAVQKNTGLTSNNASAMKSNCTTSVGFVNTTCKTNWCLHFSLVNTAAPANLSSADFKQNGYKGCATNLEWLK